MGILTSARIFAKLFEGESHKAAYTRASNWVGKYVFSGVEVGETFWKIQKVTGTDLPTVKLELYVTLDDEDESEKVCRICEEYGKLFYVNKYPNCDECKTTKYRERLLAKLKVKKAYRRQQLRRTLEEAGEI